MLLDMLTDTHCRLDFPHFDGDREEVQDPARVQPVLEDGLRLAGLRS